MEFTNIYFITYKKLGRQLVEPSDYDVCTHILNKKGEILEKTLETDKQGKLHLHTIVELRRNPYIKGFVIKGYNMDIRPVYNYKGLQYYLSKQVSRYHKDEGEEEIVEYSKQHNLFEEPDSPIAP